MARTFFVLGAALAALGVAAGAFGAHALKERLAPDLLAVWDTGAHYHLIHALGLLAASFAVERFPGALGAAGGWLLLAGIALFSGSLYALALSGVRVLGAITPFGGLCFIAGWICLALAAARSN